MSTAIARLRVAPVTVPCLAAVAVLGWLAADRGGYPVSVWAPGGIIVLALLGVAVATVPNDWRTLPGALRAAVGLLGAYVAWSYASVGWAEDRGAAWQGASRTLVYFAIFCLFALWRQRAVTAAALLTVWTLVLSLIAAIVALRLLTTSDPRTLFPAGRLLTPTGYANATAALLLMALWPALTLAASRRLPWLARGACAAGAVALCDVALLCISRGSVFAVPLCALVMFALLRDRVRRAITAVPIVAAVGAAGPTILHLTDKLGVYLPPPSIGAARTAGWAILVGALLAGAVVALGARREATHPANPATAARLARLARIGFGGAVAVVVVGGLIVVGNPVTRIDHAWSSFKGGYTNFSGSRLDSGLGSNRYDFYRVALDEFADHPLVGTGADNFYEPYLRHGHSDETPRYPHSIELRALTETGLVGAALLFGALVAAGLCALRAARARTGDDLHAAVAAGALLTALYWVVHGSFDWFFEYGGLGATAFALLGLACSLDARRITTPGWALRLPRRRSAPVVGAALAAGIIVLGGLWGADHEISAAGASFAQHPGQAYARLARARRIDPFSDTADSVTGSIALRFNDLDRADAAFRRALQRSPQDEYATLERGAIASARGEHASALALLSRAAALAPRDAIARDALTVVRTGGSIDLDALSRRILAVASQVR